MNEQTRNSQSRTSADSSAADARGVKVVILAGGLGTRISGHSNGLPKPLVEIGGKPILWHIMMNYAYQGFERFIIAVGHKGESIRRHFTSNGRLGSPACDVRFVDTGDETATGGRLKRLANVIGDGTFMMTWADGLADIDLAALLAFHRSHGKLATVTAVHPPTHFGHLSLEGDRVAHFVEKPPCGEGWINGAFFALEPGVRNYIDGDQTQWEFEPMQRLAADGQLMAYRHRSFWRCMDTEQDRAALETYWNEGSAPWKIWE